jgi:tRNA-2-methylthio-N6-dimethylallyladenosine synthase
MVLYLCTLYFICMFEIEKKVIEEDKQGKPTMVGGEIPAGAKRLYLESYGCQMNFSDSEIVASIMLENGYYTTQNLYESDVIMINTCAIRENAEQKVRKRLTEFRKLKKSKPALIVGVLGCMAERLKEKFLEEEKLVDIVVGPDAYRSLPALVGEVEGGQKAMNVLLSLEETYADISPVRLGGNGITAFISIMRGCDNMCSFCVVPFTRGRERSRNPESILQEAQELWESGYKEITLLGQNVDSYLWYGGGAKKEFKTLTEEEKSTAINFAQLLEKVAHIHPDLRIRYTTSNPRDMTDEVLQVMARYDNICKYIHLPVQSGNTAVLERMNRGYSRETYLDRVAAIKKYMPDCAISTDIICGFCGETEAEHEDTKNLMLQVEFDYAYMFNYSERPKTLAERKYKDDIPEDLKTKRLEEVIAIQRKLSLESNLKDVGKTFRVLVEGTSKRNENELFGRNSQNKVIIFPKENLQPGNYAWVTVHDCNSATLLGRVVESQEARD